MDDDEFISRLASSAPSVTPRAAGLRRALNDVVEQSRPFRQRRTRRLLIAGSAFSIVLLGGTTTALASQSLLDWLGYTPDQTIQHRNADGDFCALGMIVRPEGVAVDDASFMAAQQIFRGIDFDTLEIPANIRNDERFSDARRAAKVKDFEEWDAAHPEATMGPPVWDPESGMIAAAAYEVLVEGVTQKGLDVSHFSLESGGECAEDAG